MLQSEQCLIWFHTKCVNIFPTLANNYPFVCPYCVKAAVNTLLNISLELSAPKGHLTDLEQEHTHGRTHATTHAHTHIHICQITFSPLMKMFML